MMGDVNPTEGSTSTAREAAVRVAVLKALTDQIKETVAQARADVLKQLGAGDRKNAILPDGTSVGTVTVSVREGKVQAYVEDEAAFLAWVTEERPDEIITEVRSSYRRALLDGLAKTGEVVPGVSFSRADDSEPYVTVRQTDAQVAAVVCAWQDGSLATILSDQMLFAPAFLSRALPDAPAEKSEDAVWYLATCMDCSPVLPQPFSHRHERGTWADAHVKATGHTVQLWQMRHGVRSDDDR